jgi:RimJ/RimL family protein N-acetyltransferase
MAEVDVRVLREAHRPALAAFLDSRPDTHLFLRSNLARGRLEDEGKAFDGTWVGTVRDDGTVTSVAALFWNGVCLLQMPAHAQEILDMLAGAAPRALIELCGPTAQVEEALRHGLVRDRSLRGRHDAVVMRLSLAELAVPAALAGKSVDTRPPMGEELAMLGDWYAAFNHEVFDEPRSPESDLRARQWVRAMHDERRDQVATVDDRPVAYCAITNQLGDEVNIGAVYTPPELRGRGYARCVVAGILMEAARDGVTRAGLTALKDNPASLAAYRALGFRPAHDWTITRFFPA